MKEKVTGEQALGRVSAFLTTDEAMRLTALAASVQAGTYSGGVPPGIMSHNGILLAELLIFGPDPYLSCDIPREVWEARDALLASTKPKEGEVHEPNELDAAFAREKKLLEVFRKIPPSAQDFFFACMQTQVSKGSDYTMGREDRLANFREGGELFELSIGKVWGTYFWKHFTAIVKWINRGHVESEPLAGRILDSAVYITLLYLIALEKGVQPLPPIEELSERGA